MTEGVDGKLLNPLEFAKEILRVELWSKQEEVLSALVENRRVAVKSGNGLGKGYCAGICPGHTQRSAHLGVARSDAGVALGDIDARVAPLIEKHNPD